MLTILASFAQAESLSVSENCKWRIRKKFSVGQCPFLRMYGYRVKNSVFTVVPGEAEVVRLIYSSYLSGMGTEAIANMLNEKHIPAYGGGKWFRSTVLEILRNEKVAGNLLLQKTFRVDHLTKGKKHNKGELPQYSVEGAHDPIIDQTTFNRVKEEMAKRREIFGYGDSEKSSDERHPLFSKITCGVCGKHYVRKCGNSKSKYKKPIWIKKRTGAAIRLPIHFLAPEWSLLEPFRRFFLKGVLQGVTLSHTVYHAKIKRLSSFPPM